MSDPEPSARSGTSHREVPGVRLALYGSLLWAVWLVAASPGAIDALLGLAAAVVFPLVFRLPFCRGPAPGRLWRATMAAALPSAALLMVALWLAPRELAAALALPWLAVTAMTAVVGLARMRQRDGLGPWPEVSVDAGLVFLVVGGGSAVAACWGLRPLGFSATIIALTAVHFHYAGYALPILAGLAGREVNHAAYRVVPAGVVIGVPLVAIGITASPIVEVLGSLGLAAAASGLAVAHLVLAKRAQGRVLAGLWAVSGLALAYAMALAGIYALGEFRGMPWPSIPEMAHMHGTANALGFVLTAAWAWTLHLRAREV